jgi:hypothetical protein
MLSTNISARWQGMETRSACRDAHDAACMLSTWLQRTRRLPCLALTLCCQPSPASSLPFVRAPGRLPLPLALRCLRSLAAHARIVLRLVLRAGTPLLAVGAQASATTADLFNAPPRLRTPSPSCALARSQIGFGATSSAGSASGGNSCRPFSDGHKVRLWRYEAPEGLSRLCCRRLLRPGRSAGAV